jgi:GntR family transcriptional repressor for pyruvate dehydrogenase complex
MADPAGTTGGARDALHVQKVRPAYEQVAEQLRQQILEGRLRAGDRLPSETELLTLFGVSRSTLREALRALAARDLVHTVRGVTGGTFVSRVEASKVSSYLETSLGLMSGNDAISVEEILEARETLEVPAARLAAARATPEQVESLRAAGNRETVRNFEPHRFEEHKTFHTLLVEASGNRLLAMMNEPNFRVLATRFRRSDVPEAWWVEVDHDHVEIAEHVAAGRGDAAAEAMRRHLERLRDLYLPLDHPAP